MKMLFVIFHVYLSQKYDKKFLLKPHEMNSKRNLMPLDFTFRIDQQSNFKNDFPAWNISIPR